MVDVETVATGGMVGVRVVAEPSPFFDASTEPEGWWLLWWLLLWEGGFVGTR